MGKSLVIMCLIALFAAMSLPAAWVGPAQAQACGTEKGPPPPG
jgi:hypothetical protein